MASDRVDGAILTGEDCILVYGVCLGSTEREDDDVGGVGQQCEKNPGCVNSPASRRVCHSLAHRLVWAIPAIVGFLQSCKHDLAVVLLLK